MNKNFMKDKVSAAILKCKYFAVNIISGLLKIKRLSKQTASFEKN